MAERKKGNGEGDGPSDAEKKTTGRKSAYQLPTSESKAGAPAKDGEPQDDTADPGDEHEADVVDLDEKRAALEAPAAAGGLLEGVVGDSVRRVFREFMLDKVVPEGQRSGNVDLNVDVDFIRKHGRELLSAMVQGVAKAVLPPKVEIKMPMPKEAAADTSDASGTSAAAGSAASDSDVNVAVKFDFLEFMKGLLAPPAGTAVADATEAPGGSAAPAVGVESTPEGPGEDTPSGKGKGGKKK